MIRDSPSHIYHSALPLLPSSSWVRKCYGADASAKVKVVIGLPDQWDTCSRTMMFEDKLTTSAHWGDIIAIGLGYDVVFLDTITGIRTSVLRGHTGSICSLAFSQDGTLLMSGSRDGTAAVWDVQTGGVIRTFDHDPSISSDYAICVSGTDYDPFTNFAASISSDGAMVALGTDNGTVRLCDIRTGECNSIDMYDGKVIAIEFSPINPQHFISSSGRIVRQLGIDGDQVERSYYEADDVEDLAWMRDGTRFVSCGGKVATVRDAQSGAVVVKLGAPGEYSSSHLGCFSPDGRFVACAADTTIWVWDITISGARLVGHLVGHSGLIKFLAFSPSLISGSLDQSIKFWKSSSCPIDPTTFNRTVAHGPSTSIQSINMFAEEGIVVTSDQNGVVTIWDVMTGRRKSSFSTPAKGRRDTHLAHNTLIIVWCPPPYRNMDRPRPGAAYGDLDTHTGRDPARARDLARVRDPTMEYHIWDVYKGQLLRTFHNSFPFPLDLKISGDGSRIFALGSRCIAAMSMQTGEEVGRVELEGGEVYDLFLRDSKVWVDGPRRGGWDFSGPEVSSFEEFPDGPQLKLVKPRRNREIKPCWMEDVVTNRRVFRSLERYLDRGRQFEWDGRYLFNWSPYGSIKDFMIIDFDPVCPRSGS